jgi:hypothetical protein
LMSYWALLPLRMNLWNWAEISQCRHQREANQTAFALQATKWVMLCHLLLAVSRPATRRMSCCPCGRASAFWGGVSASKWEILLQSYQFGEAEALHALSRQTSHSILSMLGLCWFVETGRLMPGPCPSQAPENDLDESAAESENKSGLFVLTIAAAYLGRDVLLPKHCYVNHSVRAKVFVAGIRPTCCLAARPSH